MTTTLSNLQDWVGRSETVQALRRPSRRQIKQLRSLRFAFAVRGRVPHAGHGYHMKFQAVAYFFDCDLDSVGA